MPVKVGRNLWPVFSFSLFFFLFYFDKVQDQYTEDEWKRMGGQDRINKLAAPQSFFQNAPYDKLPPYPSCQNYDAKVDFFLLLYS